MPGKKGFGDTRKKSSQSPAYKKQKFGEAKSPFIMKGSPFKQGEFLSPAFYGGGAMGAADFLMGPTAALGIAGIKAYQSGQKHSGGKAGDPTAKSSFSGGKTWEEAKKDAKGKFKLKK